MMTSIFAVLFVAIGIVALPEPGFEASNEADLANANEPSLGNDDGDTLGNSEEAFLGIDKEADLTANSEPVGTDHESGLFNGKVPLGTIVAWIPYPSRNTGINPSVPDGWQLCDGSRIENIKSPWKGLYAPNLRERFLRGGNSRNFMTLQEDQVQDHWHYDRGHTHTDRGHTHTDSGHSHRDAGHSHHYGDRTLRDRGNTCSGRYWQTAEDSRTTGTSYANIQTSRANIQNSKANLNSATSNIQGVRPGVRSARVGSETRPKAAYIMWIIKIVN